MASMAAAARDIPQSSLNRDNLTVVADRSDLATVARSHNLPTPPNSISPALPAHGLKAQLQKAKLEPIDSDLDLREDANGPQRSVSPHHDASGTITSAMLATYHLPEILLNHGPLAIRHIMGYLTTSVPGFSGIPPTKARRLVVGALEGRGDGANGENEVDFEKVGWGRWDAKRRGLPGRDREATPPESLPNGGIPISRNALKAQDRVRANMFAGSAGEQFHFSHDDHANMPMMEDEADKMSMDGYESASCSEAPDDDDVTMNDDPEDVTDDEDWAAMGAAALRAESYPNMAAAFSAPDMPAPHTYNAPAGMRAFSGRSGMARPPLPNNFGMTPIAGASAAQEREAVEALLRLGSV